MSTTRKPQRRRNQKARDEAVIALGVALLECREAKIDDDTIIACVGVSLGVVLRAARRPKPQHSPEYRAKHSEVMRKAWTKRRSGSPGKSEDTPR